jgi:hypothetical protein
MFKGFWGAALSTAGLAAIGLYVFYNLYDKIIGLKIFAKLTPTQSFVIVILLAILIFAIAAFAIWVWFLSNWHTTRHLALAPEISRKGSKLEFEIPANCTFRCAATALIQSEKCAVRFDGFEETDLNAPLMPRKLAMDSTKVALERIRDIATTSIPPYKVTKGLGVYRLTVVKGVGQ